MRPIAHSDGRDLPRLIDEPVPSAAAAIARVNGGRLATRNLADFHITGLALVSPWEF